MTLWEFLFVHPNFDDFPAICLLQQCPSKKIKKQANQRKQTKTKGKTNKKINFLTASYFLPLQHPFICPGDIGGHNVSHSIPFCSISFTGKCSSMVWFKTSASWSIIITVSSPELFSDGYPKAALIHGDFGNHYAGLVPLCFWTPGPRWGRC